MSKEPVFSNAEQVEAYDRELSQQEDLEDKCEYCGEDCTFSEEIVWHKIDDIALCFCDLYCFREWKLGRDLP